MKNRAQRGRLGLVNTRTHFLLRDRTGKVVLQNPSFSSSESYKDVFLYCKGSGGVGRESFSSPVTLSQQIVLSKMPHETVMSMTTVKIGK